MKYATKGNGKARHHVVAWNSEERVGAARCGSEVDGEITFVTTEDFLTDPSGCKKCQREIDPTMG